MAYQRLSAEEKERRKKELLKKVENIIDNFQRSPADLIEYLKFNSKFYQYSKNNNALIYQQNPYAHYCGSFKAFKDMGYSVKKGEHGMKILVPYISKYFYDDNTQEWQKVSEASSEQKLKIKNGEIEIKQYTSFGVGTVFDISQTDCPVEDYPKFFGFGHASKSHRELFNAVKYYAESKGIPVEITDLKSITLFGFYNTADNSIELSDKLNDDRLLSVMTHELAHALLHNSLIVENNDKPVMQIEFEADAMSLLLRERLGISDIEDARQAHLQTSFKQYMEWAEENKSEQHCPDLSEILDNINEAYSNMVEDFDNSINHYFELHQDMRQTVNNFAQTIDDFLDGKINPTEQTFVCSTTEVMEVCGADNLDVMIYQDTIRKILSNDVNRFEHPHNLSAETLKTLPTQLQKPIMVFKGSHEGSIVLVTDLFNENNEQIIISCQLNSTNKRHEINRITSMYGKENIAAYLDTQIKKDNLIGCQKNIANQMLQSVGLYLPSEETFIDYTNIISDIDKNVNIDISENKDKETEIQKQHLDKLQTIAEYEQELNVSSEERIVEMNYSTAHWQPKSNYNPNQIEALYDYINNAVLPTMQSPSELRAIEGDVTQPVDKYYQNIKWKVFSSRFDYGDNNSINLDAIESAMKEVPVEYVFSHLTDEQRDLYADYYEASIDFAGASDVNISPASKQLYNLIIDFRRSSLATNEYSVTKTEMYNADADELSKLFKIALKLNEQNLHPIDVLRDKGSIDYYSFSCKINDSDKTKELLWKIYKNDMQIVGISPVKNGYILNSIDQNFNLYPFNDTIYKHTEFALSEAFRNNQIAKIVEPGILESCSLFKDLSIISEVDNLKYPYIQIQWSDIEHFKNSDCLSINTAQEQFDIANQTAEDGTKSTSFSLHLSDSEIFNFKYAHSPKGKEILEYIKSHLDEMQSDQAMSKSLTTLNSYINSQTTQLNHHATQSLDSFDATEYSL